MDMSTRGRDILLHQQMKTDTGMWATHVTTILAEVLGSLWQTGLSGFLDREESYLSWTPKTFQSVLFSPPRT